MILCIGEILADLIGEEENGVMKYSRYPGGAPLNVCLGISYLGGRVGFVGSVGDDIIGKYLINFVRNNSSLYYQDIHLDKKHNTTLAFVDIDAHGERHFAFNRFESADYKISYERLVVIKDFDIIHLGSLMLREEEGRNLADRALELTKIYNKKFSFDVNFRTDIYDSKKEAIKIYKKYIEEADILKISEDEVQYFTNETDPVEGLKKLVRDNQLVFLSLGSKGSYCKYKNIEVFVPTEKIKPVDTTGAGDAFYACVLKMLDEVDFDKLDEEILKNILMHANICGRLACSKKGAISALPKKEELDRYFN
ncbi:MAG: carbohydrate kinase [Acholeplasmatales bacterium]|nr:carbohydrate kinase [Acholeplasmatales bacterium]